jgi:hypothetical protein
MESFGRERVQCRNSNRRLMKQVNLLSPRSGPCASASLHEGLEAMLPTNLLALPDSPKCSLGMANLVDAARSGLRQRWLRVKHWQNGAVALRWAAASLEETEKNCRPITGHEQLETLQAHSLKSSP